MEMADTEELPRAEIEARMGAGLKRALASPAKRQVPAKAKAAKSIARDAAQAG